MRSNGRLQIQFSLLEHNLEELKKKAPGKEVLFMVKANGYGHGLIPMVRFSVEALGLKELGTATLSEAIHLRKTLPELHFTPYVFSDNGLRDFGVRVYLENALVPVIHHLEDLATFLNDPSSRRIPLVLKFDTGMNRLGINLSDLPLVIRSLRESRRSQIHHLMSHLSCSSFHIENHPASLSQLARFKELKDRLRSEGIEINHSSVANSGAIIQGVGLEEDTVRPGLMLYGPSPLHPSIRSSFPWKGKNIAKLSSTVIHCREIAKGEEVGYGGVKSPENGVLVHLALGYGDGLPCSLRGKTLQAKGQNALFLGQINMDMSALLFPSGSLDQWKRGTEISFWDHDPEKLYFLAEQLNSSPYELFCHLNDRVPRIYEY